MKAVVKGISVGSNVLVTGMFSHHRGKVGVVRSIEAGWGTKMALVQSTGALRSVEFRVRVAELTPA